MIHPRDRNPYTLDLALQLAEIPFQLLHHFTRAGGLPKAERHRFGPHRRQYLLFWMPPKEVPLRKSALIFYHGGGWQAGQPGTVPTLTEFFLRLGFPVFMPAYRLMPFAAFPQMREDVSLAYLKIRELMQENGLVDQQLLISGMSAGATLAAHLAFDRVALAQLHTSQQRFSGFISWGGPLDLDMLPDVLTVRQFTGGRRDSAAHIAANPVTYLDSAEQLPALIMHSRTDAIVPFISSESFVQKYTGPMKFIELSVKTHLDALRFATTDLETGVKIKAWLADK